MSLEVRQWIQRAAETSVCQFQKHETDSVADFDYYQANNPDYDRFLVVAVVEELPEPSEINQLVIDNIPQELVRQPTFAKNTDLVLLFKRESSLLSKKDETHIYALEEDSYSFKKNVLYFTENEVTLLSSDLNREDENWIHNREAFTSYRNATLKIDGEESAYGLFIRLYIKLPFLSVPTSQLKLFSIAEAVNQQFQQQEVLDLSKKTGLYFFGNKATLEVDEQGLDKLVEELIHERMETEPDQD